MASALGTFCIINIVSSLHRIFCEVFCEDKVFVFFLTVRVWALVCFRNCLPVIRLCHSLSLSHQDTKRDGSNKEEERATEVNWCLGVLVDCVLCSRLTWNLTGSSQEAERVKEKTAGKECCKKREGERITQVRYEIHTVSPLMSRFRFFKARFG